MRTERVSFNSGNTTLSCELYLPDRTPSAGLIVCHGFDRRGYKGYNIFSDMARKACENGFVSLVFDFRGCGESRGQFGYGWGEQNDLKAAIDYLSSREEVKSDWIFVVGHSLGGAVALYRAEVDKRIRGVALWATPHDHAYNVKRFIIRSRGRLGYFLFLFISYVDAVVNVPRLFNMHVYGIALRPRDVRQKLMKLKESVVLSRLDNVPNNVPILIVNGSSDQIVELKEAKINYEAAKQPKQLVIIESANHAFQDKEEQAIDKTLTWINKFRSQN